MGQVLVIKNAAGGGDRHEKTDKSICEQGSQNIYILQEIFLDGFSTSF